MKTLYMAVTADDLELPIAVEEKAKDLARILKISYDGLRCNLSYGYINRKLNCRFVKVEVEEKWSIQSIIKNGQIKKLNI